MENDFQKIDFTCFVCNNTHFRFFTRKQSCDLYRCQRCGLIFVYPPPGNLTEIYTKDYFLGATHGSGYVDYERDKMAMSSTFEVYFNKIEQLMPTRGRLLDVGAATGFFLDAALRRGWQVSGVEISDYAAAKARQKNLDVRTGILENAQFQKSSFDVISLWDVLEHLPNPKVTLMVVHDLLRSGGLVVLNTPNAGSLFARLIGSHWHLLVPPEHLFYFNADNLTELLKKVGFEVCGITCLGKKFTLQYILKTLATWHKFFVWQWLADKIQNRPLGQISIPINLHDNLFLIAKKLDGPVVGGSRSS
ncbi:MAG: class I SAM-dependent methyltransferase [Patescibacteria group bacterium]